MKIKLLIGLLLPVMAMAQEVKPILSPVYLDLIRKNLPDSQNKKVDSTNSIDKATLSYHGYNNFAGGFIVKNISIGPGNTVTLHPALSKDLSIAGSVSSTIELHHINRLPAVQNEYVQGRSSNGSLVWQGPETNELFSYGPSLHILEFDGINYPYDVNGRLVAAGTGNGKKAYGYRPSIFRTTAFFSHAITLQTRYRTGIQRQLSSTIKAGDTREDGVIAGKNKTAGFSASLDGNIKGFSIGGGYDHRQEHSSNSNRNGFLNRVYRSALLSPVSFDNSQGNTIGTAQRTYSLQADNPYFLLADDHRFLLQRNTGNFQLEQKFDRGKIRLSQSYEILQQQSNEGYSPGTAFFKNGIIVKRNTRDANYFLDINTQYDIPFNDYQFSGLIRFNYIYGNNHSIIAYSRDDTYNYQRSSHDIAIGFSPTYRGHNFEAGLNLADKMYASNTTITDNFLLPSFSGFVRFNELFNIDNLAARLTGTISRLNSELPIDRSFAQTGLVKYGVSNALQYIPVTEINSFENLLPIEHREYTAGMELSYKNKIALSVDWFARLTSNDIFPMLNGSKPELINMASHRNKGIELELKIYPYRLNEGAIFFSNTISFLAYRSKVTSVKAGYNFTALAGFGDVNKAIIIGEPLGVIVGSTYLKDRNNNIVIGRDGFPLVNTVPSVIGNPVPDFVMKMTHYLGWKKWNIQVDWEWKKGGDEWNGTAALLDYYGRSAGSAQLRNTVNYAFNGVQQNGTHNSIPVSFYDPSQPLEQSRWVRYGAGGVAESYIQKAGCIRLSGISISYKPKFKKYFREPAFTLYASNIMLWSAYNGADPNQLLNGQPGMSGLDFFNLPSYSSFGFSVSLQF